MRRLVVGCGYLGGRVARLWRQAGDEVYATTRGARVDELSREGLQPIRLDVTRETAMDALPAVDTVVFAVGRSGTTMFDIHVKGLRSVLDALPASTGRVIYVSSTGVYAQSAGEWVDEESECEPTSDGGRACLGGERLLFAHAHGANAVVLRMAGLYGSGRVPHANVVTAGGPISGSPSAYLNLVHVDDASRAVAVAADLASIAGRTYSVSDGHPPTRGEYVELVARRLAVVSPGFAGATGLGKRVRNTRVIDELGLQLDYPSCHQGLAAWPEKTVRSVDGGRRPAR